MGLDEWWCLTPPRGYSILQSTLTVIPTQPRPSAEPRDQGRRGTTVKRGWFAPWGWVHRPVSAPGWVLVVLAAAFCVQVFLAVDARSHSASDTLYGIFPFVVPCLILLEWVASKTSR